MSQSTVEKFIDDRLAAQRAVLVKAQEDLQFRARLKADPVAAVQEAFGVNWNPEIKLEVIEESADRVVLVLPALVAAANDEELSDDQLESVAAGVIIPPSLRKDHGSRLEK